MPAHRESLAITDAYRARQTALAKVSEKVMRDAWSAFDVVDIDATYAQVLSRAVPTVSHLQAGSVRLAAAYLAAFVGSELRQPPQLPQINTEPYVGRSRTDRPLVDALAPTAITIKKAIAGGSDPPEAAEHGLNQALRLAAAETAWAGRGALQEGIRENPRIIGWRRVTGGGCGACLAAATGAIHADEEALPVHDHCQCSTEPVIADAPDNFQRPTGHDMFEALPLAAQDELLGSVKAQLVRSGDVPFHALVSEVPMAAMADQLTEAPLKAFA